MVTILRIGVLAAVLSAGGAVLMRAQPAQGSKAWPIADAPAAFKPVIVEAEDIFTAQRSALMSQLTRALKDGGVAGALKACHLEATTSANRTGRSQGYPTGRTSDRLRDPTNKPRAWAARTVETNAGRQAADVSGVVVDLGDRIGVMQPIAMQPLCDSCHGDPDLMTPSVRAELKDRYPSDRAVGFKAGELRGWFWIEIPKTAVRQP